MLDVAGFEPGYFHDFEVSADGQRFLFIRADPGSRPTRLDVILNWFPELARLVNKQVRLIWIDLPDVRQVAHLKSVLEIARGTNESPRHWQPLALDRLTWVSRFMYDELSVLKLVAGRLDAAGIAYMVTGSVAVSFYAEPRMTRDVDLVAELRPSDTARLIEMFGAEFTCDVDRIRDAITRQTVFNLIHTRAIVKIDFSNQIAASS